MPMMPGSHEDGLVTSVLDKHAWSWHGSRACQLGKATTMRREKDCVSLSTIKSHM
jgi:hypothetical protein